MADIKNLFGQFPLAPLYSDVSDKEEWDELFDTQRKMSDGSGRDWIKLHGSKWYRAVDTRLADYFKRQG